MKRDCERSKRKQWDSKHYFSNIRMNNNNWNRWWCDSSLNSQSSLNKKKNKSQGQFTKSRNSSRKKGRIIKCYGLTTKSWRTWRTNSGNNQLDNSNRSKQQEGRKLSVYDYKSNANIRNKWVQCKQSKAAANNWKGSYNNALTNTISSTKPSIRPSHNHSFIVIEPKNSKP